MGASTYSAGIHLIDLVYPVGSIYMSVSSTSPEILFGGTWERLKDQFLLGAGDIYELEASGGAASTAYTPLGTVGEHTLTTDELPSHSHTFSGSAVNTGGESAGHTHTGGTGGISANHYHSGPSHTHGNKSLSGSFWLYTALRVFNSGGGIVSVGSASTSARIVSTNGDTDASGKTGHTITINASHEHSADGTGGTGWVSSDHSHSFTSNGNSVGHTHSVTASGSIGSTGSGSAHSHGFTGTESQIATMPPYTVVNMWKRTA